MALDWLNRLLLSMGIILVGLSLYWITNRVLLSRIRDKGMRLPYDLSGNPVILYFTTPACVPCKTVQRPAVRKILEMYAGKLDVIEVDATEEIDLARHWGVLSVPTTFILDSRGVPRFVNHGVTRADKLMNQINNIQVTQ